GSAARSHEVHARAEAAELDRASTWRRGHDHLRVHLLRCHPTGGNHAHSQLRNGSGRYTLEAPMYRFRIALALSLLTVLPVVNPVRGAPPATIGDAYKDGV